MIAARNIASVRTVTPATWAAVLVWLLDRLGIVVDDASLPVVLAVAIGFMGVVHRAALELEARWAWIGRVFLGRPGAPTYPEG